MFPAICSPMSAASSGRVETKTRWGRQGRNEATSWQLFRHLWPAACLPGFLLTVCQWPVAVTLRTVSEHCVSLRKSMRHSCIRLKNGSFLLLSVKRLDVRTFYSPDEGHSHRKGQCCVLTATDSFSTPDIIKTNSTLCHRGLCWPRNQGAGISLVDFIFMRNWQSMRLVFC